MKRKAIGLHNRPWTLGALFALGCSGEADMSFLATSSQAATAATIGARDEPREITIATDPHAKCTVYSYSPDESMPVWADDLGLVHLWVADAAQEGTYHLECVGAGAAIRHEIDLSDPAMFTPAAPRVLPTGRTILPALTEPMSLTEAELIQAGYPPRPDPVLAAPLYEQWLELVSTPTILVPPHFGAASRSAVWS